MRKENRARESSCGYEQCRVHYFPEHISVKLVELAFQQLMHDIDIESCVELWELHDRLDNER